MNLLLPFKPSKRGAISYIYKLLSSLQNPSLEILKSAWEGDLGVALTTESNGGGARGFNLCPT